MPEGDAGRDGWHERVEEDAMGYRKFMRLFALGGLMLMPMLSGCIKQRHAIVNPPPPQQSQPVVLGPQQ